MVKDTKILYVRRLSNTMADIRSTAHDNLIAQIKLSEGRIGTTDYIPGFQVEPYYHGALRYSVCI